MWETGSDHALVGVRPGAFGKMGTDGAGAPGLGWLFTPRGRPISAITRCLERPQDTAECAKHHNNFQNPLRIWELLFVMSPKHVPSWAPGSWDVSPPAAEGILSGP